MFPKFVNLIKKLNEIASKEIPEEKRRKLHVLEVIE